MSKIGNQTLYLQSSKSLVIFRLSELKNYQGSVLVSTTASESSGAIWGKLYSPVEPVGFPVSVTEKEKLFRLKIARVVIFPALEIAGFLLGSIIR